MKEDKKSSRSARRHDKTLQSAIEKRADLLDGGKLSVPAGAGKLAILYSTATNYHSDLHADHQKLAFRNEAHAISEKSGRDMTIIDIVSDMSMRFALRDPEVSDVVVIGHGSIGDLWYGQGAHYDWRNVAKDASHLKQGEFVQRVCGNFTSNGRSVALGTFAVADLASLIAPVGKYIEDAEPDESVFSPVYVPHIDLAEQIEQLNQKHTPPQ